MGRKQGIALLVIAGILSGICGCNTGKAKEAEVEEISFEANADNRETEESVMEEEVNETGEIISITMAEMEEKLAAGETFLVSFVTIDCPYCQDFHSMLVDYIQEHIVTMYQVILDYEEKPEEENRRIIKEYFSEFNTVPGVFYVINGENGSYLDTYNLGVGMEVFDAWVQENNIEAK